MFVIVGLGVGSGRFSSGNIIGMKVTGFGNVNGKKMELLFSYLFFVFY